MPNVELFAVNLLNPTHMEWTLDGKLLVSEYSAGRLKEITSGGDFSETPPFAFGLQGPSSILPLDDGRILVAENWGGRISDVSKGGDISLTAPYIDGLSNPYSLTSHIKGGQRKIYVSEHYNGRDSWISDITDPSAPSKYVTNIPARPGSAALVPLSQAQNWQKFASANCVINWGGGGVNAHYITVGAMGQILDVFSQGGDYIDLIKAKKAIAWDLGRMGAIKEHPNNGLLYAVEPELGDIVAIDPTKPKNHRFTPPVVRGFMNPTCLRFSPDGKTMLVCSKGDGVVWRVTEFE